MVVRIPPALVRHEHERRDCRAYPMGGVLAKPLSIRGCKAAPFARPIRKT
jgi:hypothetical protein